MRAIIQAGGKGSRLRNITGDEIPKPMVSVAGKPLLQWQIELLKKNGIEEIFLIIGYLGGVIRDYFKSGNEYGVSIIYIEEKQPLGTAGGLYYLKEYIQPEEDFVLLYGDIFLDVDLSRFMAFHQKKKAVLTAFVHPNGHSFDSDIIEMDEDNRITNLLSKKEARVEWYGNLVNAALYIINVKIIQRLKKVQKVDFEKEILFEMIKKTAPVYGYRSTEYVKDAGTEERLCAIKEDIQSGLIKKRSLKYKQKCIFLDRDGTITKQNGLVDTEDKLEVMDCAANAIRKINASEYLTIVVTNQPVVARGMCTEDDVKRFHKKMETLLGEKGAYLDDIIFCPHHPDKGFPEENPAYKKKCNCRKPATGMLEQMKEKYHISLEDSWMIGDTTVDIMTGKNAGMKTALVLTGEAGKDEKYDAVPDIVGEDLEQIVNQILKMQSGTGMNYLKDIRDYIELEKKTLDSLDIHSIDAAMHLIQETYEKEGNIYIFGNGGSSATASHYQNDFNKGLSEKLEKKFRMVCLNNDLPTIMAIANDFSFDEVFRYQLEGRLKKDDLVIAISGSGNSKNIIRAVSYAKEQGNPVIGLCGYSGGRLKELSDIAFHVNIDNMQICEDIHMVLDHLMMTVFYKYL